MPVPGTAIHHIVPEPGYRPSRHGSRTPSLERSDTRERRPSRRRGQSRTPSYKSDREPRRGSRYRLGSYRSATPPYYVPGPEYGVGAPIEPPAVTHVHACPYPPPSQRSYPPPSPTSVLVPRTDQKGDPLPHPFGAPSQYLPQEQFPAPATGRAPPGHRPSLAPTVVEVVGPEPIQVHPGQPRTASGRKYCNIYTAH